MSMQRGEINRMKLSERSAMVFAAGLGNRMQPLTANCPKPLLKVGEKTFLQRALDHIAEAGIGNIVVNSFYFPEQVRDALEAYPEIHISEESERLETGGGAKVALPLLGNEAFFTLNGDVVWQSSQLLQQLHDKWDDQEMDALLLLVPRDVANGSAGPGDFVMGTDGSLQRFSGQSEPAYIYTGCQLISPKLFAGTPDKFSVNALYDKAIAEGRLYGQVLDGDWYHLSTPEDLAMWAPVIQAEENERVASGGRL